MKFSFDADIVLENAVALLRPLQTSDIENLLDIATSDKTLLQFSPAPIYTKELLEKYVDKAIESRLDKTRYSFSIFDKAKNGYAGTTSFLNISEFDSRLEIGSTWVGKKFQKTGLNRNCKYLLLEFAFDSLGAARVEFKTDERNFVSRNAIEKIGGEYEGILRSHTLMHDGFRRNTICYSILKNEWDILKFKFLEQK